MSKKALFVIILILIVILAVGICFAVHLSIRTQTPEKIDGDIATTSTEMTDTTETPEGSALKTEEETTAEEEEEPTREGTSQVTQHQEEPQRPAGNISDPTEAPQAPTEAPQAPTDEPEEPAEVPAEPTEQTIPDYAPGEGDLPVMPLGRQNVKVSLKENAPCAARVC